MNFIEKGGKRLNRKETISGDDVHYCSEEERKMAWMRETRIRIYT